MLRFGLIGYPLGHSRSAEYLNGRFSELGLSATYTAYPMPRLDGLQALLDDVQLSGFNVTIPHKRLILALLDGLTPAAEGAGAVNTVVVDRRSASPRLIGHNTDMEGFRNALADHDVLLYGHALILGQGGAALAAARVLQEAGMEVRFIGRRPGPGVLDWKDTVKDVIAGARLIVNATPLGMSPQIQSAPPIDYSGLHTDQVLFDMVYNPEDTHFLQEGRIRGCTVIGGLGMLHHQAEASLRWWLEQVEGISEDR
ncbi:MAG TPA: shikimate dehydrogenase [Bacteroidales bacterium]|nr:shikimate dehydrogenase [Bacteroidales bacterium]